MSLGAEFYARPVLVVARDLIGCVVEHEGIAGIVVETEAYHESEPACHAFVGVTPRTQIMFGEPGCAYVYRSYGIHALLNAVCQPVGVGAAVLIRALEPLRGIERMRAHRGGVRDVDLCSGPGKLTQALGIGLSENGTSLLDGTVRIQRGAEGVSQVEAGDNQGGNEVLDRFCRGGAVVVGTRIGITKAVELKWRFCAADSHSVSRPWPPQMRDPWNMPI